jgi:hypothetical protein
MKKKVFTLAAAATLFLSYSVSFAQIIDQCSTIPEPLTNSRDVARALAPTPDGGFVLVGTMFDAANDRDMYFVKYDANFTATCSLKLGDFFSIFHDEAFTVLVAPDGYYIAGSVLSTQIGSTMDVGVVKISNSCDILWGKRYGGTRDDLATKILPTYNVAGALTSIVVTGSSRSFNANTDWDMLAFRIDPSGNMLTGYYTYGTSPFNELSYSATSVNSTEFVLTGERDNNGDRDVYSVRIKADLSFMASSILFGNAGNDEFATGVTIIGNLIYITGVTNKLGTDDVFLAQYSTPNLISLALNNSRIYPGVGVYAPNSETATGILRASDGRLVISGFVRTSNDLDGLLMKIEPSTFNIDPVVGVRHTSIGFIPGNDGFNAVTELTGINATKYLMAGFAATAAGSADEDIFMVTYVPGSVCCLVSYDLAPTSTLGVTLHSFSNKFNSTVPPSHFTEEDYHDFHQFCTVLRKGDEFNFYDVVYPNPASEYITVNNYNSLLKKAVVFDATGRTVKIVSVNPDDTERQINIRDLKNGIYIIELTDTENKITKAKISIQH